MIRWPADRFAHTYHDACVESSGGLRVRVSTLWTMHTSERITLKGLERRFPNLAPVDIAEAIQYARKHARNAT